MRSATTRGHRTLAATRRDPWDEDDALADEEAGPSWTKAYVGGMKVRQYAVTAVADLVPDPQQPRGTLGRRDARRIAA